jgi:hypothetical protein
VNGKVHLRRTFLTNFQLFDILEGLEGALPCSLQAENSSIHTWRQAFETFQIFSADSSFAKKRHFDFKSIT